MLVLTLKINQQVFIGDQVAVMVVDIRGKQVRLGIEAPAAGVVLREDAVRIEKIYRQNESGRK